MAFTGSSQSRLTAFPQREQSILPLILAVVGTLL
jgi:hypothetical protein